MAGIQLVVELDDKGTPKLRKLDEVLAEVGQETTKTASTWKKSFDKMGSSVAGLHGRMKNFATSIPAMLGYAGLAAGLGLIVKRGMDFNAELEATETSLGVMVHDTTRARNMMKELVSFAAKTPFALAETASAAKVLEGSLIGSSKMLERVGDAASFAQVPVDEMAGAFSRLASGAFGEAFEYLRLKAIATRPMLEAKGLEFDGSGSYQGSAKQAMDAVAAIVDERFGGMTMKMGQTWRGLMSTLNDNISATFANFTGPLFDRLKVRLGQFGAAFDKLSQSQALRNLGELIAVQVDKAAGALLKLTQNPDAFVNLLRNIGGWLITIGAGAWAFGKALVAGVKWGWDVLKAFIAWAPWAWTRALAVMADKVNAWKASVHNFIVDIAADITDTLLAGLTMLPGQMGMIMAGVRANVAAQFAGLHKDAADGVSALAVANKGSLMLFGRTLDDIVAEYGGSLNAMLSAPGAFDSWTKSIERIKKKMGELPVAMPGPLWGAPTGPGLDMPQAQAPAAGGMDEETRRIQEAHQKWSEIGNQWAVKSWVLAEGLKKMWADYWKSLDQMAMGFLSDSITEIILKKGQSLKESLDQIWQSMKASFVRNAVEMGLAWVRNRIVSANTDRKYGAKEAAARAAYAAVSVGASKAEGSAAASSAAAKYHAATAWLPFVGPGLATAAIAKMVGDIQAVGKLSMFRAGTSYVPGAAGAGDSVPALLAPGEAVIPAARVRQYGLGFMDSLRAGTLGGGGGGDVFAPQITINGAGDPRAVERVVRDSVIPHLERLYRQRRLELRTA